jgi:ABC-type dipeptide/oligopeptide/nickel transport system ATPase component
MILKVVNLSVNYPQKNEFVSALKKVSFEIYKGEIFGIVGESGSGKSTLAFSILNLLPQDTKRKGEIIFRNQNIFSLKEKELENLRGNKIGMVFQDPASTFNPVLSIRYQFEEILKEKLGIKNKEERLKIIFDSLKKVKLPEIERIIKSYPHQLSGGQLQRIAIGMAISLKPLILIADEPTSSLDVTIESQILYLLKELNRKFGLTIIFITHNLDLVNILCDRVMVLYKGEVKEIKSKEQLFANPKDSYTKKLLDAFEELNE